MARWKQTNCSPLKSKVVASGVLPEVEQSGRLMRTVYEDFCVLKLRGKTPVTHSFPAKNRDWTWLPNIVDCFENAELALRHAVIFMLHESLDRPDSSFLNSVCNDVIGRLDMEACVSQQVQEMISARQAFWWFLQTCFNGQPSLQRVLWSWRILHCPPSEVAHWKQGQNAGGRLDPCKKRSMRRIDR